MKRAAATGLIIAVLVGAGTWPAFGAERMLPQSREQITLSYAPLVKKAAPAVVNIYAKRVVRSSQSPIFDDPFFRQFFGDDFFGMPRERVQNSLGSGVIVRPEGIIVTNSHVIDQAHQITVVLADRRELPAKLILTDERTDLAVLQVDNEGKPLPYLELSDSDRLEVGDLVLAIGNPFGVGQTVTSGIVSAVARAAAGVSDFSFFIQTDAAINPGNSGGALIAMDGRVVGINTAIYSRSGGSQGIGFAIPANMVRAVLAGALKDQKIVRPWLGVSTQEITSDVAKSIGMERPVGVIVTDVHPAGPAKAAGLQPGDVIAAVNDHEVAEPSALRFRIATLPVGEKARLTVLRGDKRIAISFPLEAPPEDPPRNVTKLEGRHPFSGATVANLSPALSDELSLDPMMRGVIVLALDQGSPAARIGLRPGDLVAEVNSQSIVTVDALERALSRRAPRWAISIRRGGRTLSVVIEA